MSTQHTVFWATYLNNRRAGLREGQSLMNALNAVSGSDWASVPADLDPFYDDSRVPQFMDWVCGIGVLVLTHFDHEGSIVAHEGEIDRRMPLDPRPYGTRVRRFEHIRATSAEFARVNGMPGAIRLRFAPRPGYSQKMEDYT